MSGMSGSLLYSGSASTGPGRLYGDIDSAPAQTVTNDDCIQDASHRQTVYCSRQWTVLGPRRVPLYGCCRQPMHLNSDGRDCADRCR